MKKTIVAFGEVLWDILPSCTVLGGAPFNFAYRVNTLGEVGLMASRLGRDELGQRAFDQIVSLGLDTRLLQWDDQAPTGTVQVSFDAQNDPDYVIVPDVAYDRILPTELLIDAVERADCVCFGTLVQRALTSAQTLATLLLDTPTNALKLLDINLRKECYDEQSVVFSLGCADVLKLNEDEAHAIGRMLGLRHQTLRGFCEGIVAEWGIEYCLITLGCNGAFGYQANGRETYAPGYQVALVDTIGSGDAFSAGFVHKMLRGAPLQDAVAFGNMLGAIVATQTGATAPITEGEIDRFLERDLERSTHPEFQGDAQEGG